jgi:hypothetical protein
MKDIIKSTPFATGIQPEWITVAEACEYASISKPCLYSWLDRGLVRNFSNKQPGQIKGKRLISFPSLRRFLESRATGGLAD